MRRPGLLVALIVSLALNLFLICAGRAAYVFVRHAPATAVGSACAARSPRSANPTAGVRRPAEV